MRKYLLTLQIAWQNGFVYRTSVILWRLRNLLSTLMSLTVWTVIFQQQETVFNYSQPSMITYIFLISILQSFILSTALNGLPGRIYSGQISFEMLKPINLIAYFAAQDIADKLKNFFFVIGETTILYLIFDPRIILPTVTHGLIFLLWVLLGTVLHFILNLLFGAIGFWSPDAWGPKFLFFMLVDFTAGKMYPLDILPNIIQQLIYATPFPYLSYAQVQIFLGKFSPWQIFANSLALIGWIIGLAILTHFIWQKGFKDYSAAGQ